MNEKQQESLKKVFFNILKAIIVLFYFIVMNFVYGYVNTDVFNMVLKISTMVFLFTTLVIFEKAYKKDDDDLAIFGIEFLVLAIFNFIMKHTAEKFKVNYQNYAVIIAYLFAIYFVLRAIIIHIKSNKENKDEKVEDVKEEVKKND